jgi:hypothetical protein
MVVSATLAPFENRDYACRSVPTSLSIGANYGIHFGTLYVLYVTSHLVVIRFETAADCLVKACQ